MDASGRELLQELLTRREAQYVYLGLTLMFGFITYKLNGRLQAIGFVVSVFCLLIFSVLALWRSWARMRDFRLQYDYETLDNALAWEEALQLVDREYDYAAKGWIISATGERQRYSHIQRFLRDAAHKEDGKGRLRLFATHKETGKPAEGLSALFDFGKKTVTVTVASEIPPANRPALFRRLRRKLAGIESLEEVKM